MKTPKSLLALLLLSILVTSCFEDKDDNPISTLDINSFVYRGMDSYYLYRDLVPDLIEDKANSSNFDTYLNSFDAPEALFESLIYDRTNTDKFSWIVNDYIALEQQFDGITKSNGMEFGLTRYTPGGNELYGIVRFVLPNTSAETNGLQRGDLFNAVNSTPLTISNWRTLLGQDNLTLNFATYNTNGTPDIDDDTVDATNNTINLSRIQYVENPIFKTEILQVEGENVGYLMYNGFVGNFDSALNAAFGEFQANNVQHLVLDFRYNPGGSVNTATLLGSLVTGQYSGQVYAKLQYNSIQQGNNFNYTFVDNIEGSALNSLNLNKVYVLATGSSASASEMVINSLGAYIDVIQIGTQTVGKSQASITLYDSPNFTRTEANPNHTYAMQPLVAITVNKNDTQVPAAGIIPSMGLEIEEQTNNFGILGNANEPLLAEALAHIAATNRLSHVPVSKAAETVFDSNDLLPHKKEMYIER
ncbi:S41 family peptidase [Lacinutrix jangbogonensis]|uniref:S41 family peptidase n=1 Tax=Lacinutrix jangbogonensis TaxID=1469557 RepID=UPI00053CF589|nr:S41 family peptidase [Lacinutrix jangbogonensis]